MSISQQESSFPENYISDIIEFFSSKTSDNIIVEVGTRITSDGGFVFLLTIFVLACFIGYYVVWNVTPALHSPLMSVTNAISSVIIVGALLASGGSEFTSVQIVGIIAIVLVAINIVGGFLITSRMLALYKSKQDKNGDKSFFEKISAVQKLCKDNISKIKKLFKKNSKTKSS